jgi:glycosyltransferase involved in cell wall biosynthesis
MENHRQLGIANVRMAQLPYFIPDNWSSTLNDIDRSACATPRPYFFALGRLVKCKGFQDVILHMKDFPEMDLIIAGDGPYQDKLRQYATGLSNVRFTGLLGFKKLMSFYDGARAVIVPSLLYETFGYVVAEAFAMGTPVIVSNRGSLPELVAQSDGGLIYNTPEELAAAMKAIASDDTLRNRLGRNGRDATGSRWSEKKHINLYIELILDAMKQQEAGGPSERN